MKKTLLISLLVVSSSLVGYAATDAVAVWNDKCAKCHGADGAGDTKMGKKLRIRDLTDAAVQATFTDEAICKAVTEGVKDDSGKSKMKPVEGMSDDEVKAMIPVVRGFQK